MKPAKIPSHTFIRISGERNLMTFPWAKYRALLVYMHARNFGLLLWLWRFCMSGFWRDYFQSSTTLSPFSGSYSVAFIHVICNCKRIQKSSTVWNYTRWWFSGYKVKQVKLINKRRSFDPEIAFTTELSEYLSHASLERVDMLAFRQGQIIEIFENAISITSMWKTLELLTERKNFRLRCLINEVKPWWT